MLVVHANAEKRTAICQALQVKGYATVEAGDGLEALRLLDTDDSLVIAHETLPIFSGWQLLDCLQRNRDTKDIPVILLLDDFNAARIFAAHQAGVSSVLEATDEPKDIASFAISLLRLIATRSEREPCDPFA